eukprot:m.78242 g.78242  ORF g.78242 m.78242 type:complete len:152 (-) comp14103_c0_seq1:373-828(-)
MPLSRGAQQDVSSHELGSVNWQTDFNQAVQHAMQMHRPIVLFLKHDSGSVEAKDFGQRILSNDTICNAINSDFVPVVVEDEQQLEQFMRKYHDASKKANVMMFLHPRDQTEIVPRLAGHGITLKSLSSHLVDSLIPFGLDANPDLRYMSTM